MSDVLRVLLVDDDPVVRRAYRTFLSTHDDLEVVGEARDGAEAVDAYADQQPDVVLMDLQMPNVSGVEATRRIVRAHPEACIVVLTTFGTQAHVVTALRAGAAGYLVKDASPEELIAAIHQAVNGEMPLSGQVRRELVTSLVSSGVEPELAQARTRLTKREAELLKLLAQGLTNQQIGVKMHVSEGSVKQYLSHIGDKFGVKSRTGILIRSVQLRVVDPHNLPPVTG